MLIDKLTIISTCSDRKRYAQNERLALSSFLSSNIWRTTLIRWIDAINDPHRMKFAARDVYSGKHWKETLNCHRLCSQQGFNCDLWIMSAGMGLIPMDYPIPVYSATFANGADSIHKLDWGDERDNRTQNKIWWQGVNRNRGWELPPTIAELSKQQCDNNCILIICSPPYYYAIEPELLQVIGNNPNLLVFCAGLTSRMGSVHHSLRPHIVLIDDRFKSLAPEMNSVNVALNAVVAKWFISNHLGLLQDGVMRVIDYFAEIAKDLPRTIRKPVVSMTDDEVKEFISKNYSPQSSASTLLRILRHQDNKSCEQKRFGKLFANYRKEHILRSEACPLFSNFEP